MAIGNVRNLQFLVLNGLIFLSWKLKNNFKKVNLISSNPLVHLHIQGYRVTDSVNLRQYWDLDFQATTFQNTYEWLLLIFWLSHLLPMGSSIKNVRTNLGIFGTPLPLSRSVHIRLTTFLPCPCGHKAGIIWNTATCEQFTLKGKKNWSFWYWMYTHVCSY